MYIHDILARKLNLDCNVPPSTLLRETLQHYGHKLSACDEIPHVVHVQTYLQRRGFEKVPTAMAALSIASPSAPQADDRNKENIVAVARGPAYYRWKYVCMSGKVFGSHFATVVDGCTSSWRT